jgi:hypothetical protein
MTTGSPAKPSNTPAAQKPRAPGTKIDKPAHELTHNANKIKSLKDRPASAPSGGKTGGKTGPTWNEIHNSDLVKKAKENRS